ncbi:hypothetical protein K438DRAFT_1770877 [Mycena galopus ATCC 62051]|nr:hypothetical protein K438DRAFT_1770877 [Mycena galopus ATCC 62051]
MEGGISLLKKASLPSKNMSANTGLRSRTGSSVMTSSTTQMMPGWMVLPIWSTSGDADPTTRPTRREALSAAATLQSFVTTLGDEYARKLDHFRTPDAARGHKCHVGYHNHRFLY